MRLPPGSTEEIKTRLQQIRQDKRSRIRWRLSHHTAELAIQAIEGHISVTYRPGSKSRRRKRYKRLL